MYTLTVFSPNMAANRSRLIRVEAFRVSTVLEESLQKLAFLSSIAPDVLAHREELSLFVGDEISRIIKEQRSLEKRYEELISQRATLKGLANKSKYKKNQQELGEVSRMLRESTKNLCRTLKDNPNVGGSLLKIQRERTDLEELLRDCFDELEKSCVFAKIVETVEADNQEQKDIADLEKRELRLTKEVKELETELEEQQKQYHREVKERRDRISALKKSLRELKTNTVVHAQYAKQQAKAKMQANKRDYEQTESKMRDTLEYKKTRQDRETTVHGAVFEFVENKTKDLRELCDYWQKKFVDDSKEKDDELELLTEERTRDKTLLDHLRERFATEKATKDAMEAERRQMAALEKSKHDAEMRKIKAAETLQREWRQVVKNSQAKALDALRKKKKGKKKKGKKKKKKK